MCPSTSVHLGAPVKIKVLGPIEVVGDRAPLRLPRRQGRLAVGLLALEPNRVVSVDRLLDLMWGDEPPSSARAILHSRISEVRRVFADGNLGGAASIRPAEGGYSLTIDPEAVDAERFRSLVAEASASTRHSDGAAKLREAVGL